MAVVKGKGNKVRPIYFGARTARSLDRYLRIRSSQRWAHLDALFLTQRGALTADGARERVRVRGGAAEIEHLHPHRFRQTFAHDFLMAGGQERDLKRLPAGRPTSCSSATAPAPPMLEQRQPLNDSPAAAGSEFDLVSTGQRRALAVPRPTSRPAAQTRSNEFCPWSGRAEPRWSIAG